MHSIKSLAILTLKDPRQGARVLIDGKFPQKVAWMALFLTAIFSAFLTKFSFLFMRVKSPSGQDIPSDFVFPSPLELALGQIILFSLMAVTICYLGRWFGGKGSFSDTVILVSWLQFILLFVQILQLVIVLFIPIMGGILTAASLVFFFWLLTHFIMELHGFTSVFKTLLSIVFFILFLLFLLSVWLLPIFSSLVPLA